MPYYLRITVIATLAITILAPIGLVIYQAGLDAPFFLPSAKPSLFALSFVFSDPEFYEALWTSLVVATGMTVIAVPLGVVLGFLLVRTDIPGRRWIEPIVLVPMFVSSIVLAFGYIVTFGPVGFVSLAAKQVVGYVPWDLYTLPTIIAIAGLTHVPHVALYAMTALRTLGSDVEDAARSAGAGPFRVAFTVSIPMIMPAILYSSVLLFFLGFELFGLPLVLGDQSDIIVLATYLYKLTNKLGVPSYQLMAVVVLVLILISLPLVLMQRKFLQQSNRYVSMGGKGGGSKPIAMGPWKWPALAIIAFWVLVTVAVPVAGIVLRSFLWTWGEGADLLAALTVDHYRQLWNYPSLVRGVTNTLLIAAVGGAASVAVYTVISLAAHRWKSGWVRILDYLVLLPRAMPGLVAGLAIFWVFLFVPLLQPLRQTLFSLWIAYSLVWLAYGMRLVSSAMLQISPELEEAGRTIGASPGRVSRDITIPLIRAGLIGSWLLVFVTFVKEYSTGVYLLTPGTEVIGSLLVSLWSAGNVELVTALSTLNIVMICAGLLLISLFVRQRHV